MSKMNKGGGTNIVEMECSNSTLEKIKIEINGERNTVIIEELVEVESYLDISIEDNDNYVFIGRSSTFEATSIAIADNNNKVIIGEDCMFARNTKILASDFHSIIDLKTGIRRNVAKEVRIDNHVWIGFGCIVLKNTHIMSNSIMAANSVVSGNILANCVYTSFKNIKVNKKDLTWERQRDIDLVPLQQPYVRYRKRINLFFYKFLNISKEENIVFHIENNIENCFNKIQGWAFWMGRDSCNSQIYIRCMFHKHRNIKEIVVPLVSLKSYDVVNAFNEESYRYCRFCSYMPSVIINSQTYIKSVELLINNKTAWGKVIIFERE